MMMIVILVMLNVATMTISMKTRRSAMSTYAASEIYEHPDWKQLFQSITSAFASIAKNIQANVLKMTQMGDNQSLRPRKLLHNSFNICFFLFLNQKIN